MAPVKDYAHPYLNYLVHHADVISFELNQLINDGLTEAIYCKDLRQTALSDATYENIYKIENMNELDLEPCDWHLCEKDEYKKLSPWATIKHYMLVLKKDIFHPNILHWKLTILKSEKANTRAFSS